MKQQIPPKKYPRTSKTYRVPVQKGPAVRRPARPLSAQKKGFKALVFSLLGIVVVFGAFLAKKYYEEKKEISLEKLQQQSENVDLDIEYATPKEVLKSVRNKSVQLVDIREPSEFATKHIESSINIPLTEINEKINLISKDKLVIIIDRDEESKIGKVFTDHLKKEGVTVKYLEGGILNYSQTGYSLVSKGNPALTEDIVKVSSLSVEAIKNRIKEGKLFIFLDVRTRNEFHSENIDGSINIPLEELEDKKSKIPIGTILVYDSDSIRSFQAAVRLYDMNVMDVYNSIANYETLKQELTAAAEEAKNQQQPNTEAEATPTETENTTSPAEQNNTQSN